MEGCLSGRVSDRRLTDRHPTSSDTKGRAGNSEVNILKHFFDLDCPNTPNVLKWL